MLPLCLSGLVGFILACSGTHAGATPHPSSQASCFTLLGQPAFGPDHRFHSAGQSRCTLAYLRRLHRLWANFALTPPPSSPSFHSLQRKDPIANIYISFGFRFSISTTRNALLLPLPSSPCRRLPPISTLHRRRHQWRSCRRSQQHP